MSRPAKGAIEFRNYDLASDFPIQVIGANGWPIDDYHYPALHFHNCLEIGICEDGKGIMQFGSAQRPFSGGDVTVVSGDVAHNTWSDPGTISTWSWIFVDLEGMLRPYFSIESMIDHEAFSAILSGYCNVIPGKQFPSIYSCANILIRELILQELNYQASVRGILLSLVCLLTRVNRYEGRGVVPSNMVIAPALNYIRLHFTDTIPVETLADTCKLSVAHFRKVFNKIMGQGPVDYVNTLRVQKACALLRMTDESVLSVSERVGFHSISNFNRQFSAIMGITPTEWRRQQKGTTSVLKYNGWLSPLARK